MEYSNKFLGKEIVVKIDRPIGSKHPKYGNIYPINYGFIEGTKAPDDEEIDAYILGIDKPLKDFKGICIAIIHRIDDNDDKLIVVPKGKKFSDEEIIDLTNFQEKFFKSELIR